MPSHLFVCSGGGHLKQLDAFASRMNIPADEQMWVTFDTGLSRSLLKDRETVYAPYTAPRDLWLTVRNGMTARRILKGNTFQGAYSTGSSLALSYLHLAARTGASAHFIESAARAAGPSKTGSLIMRDRKVHTYTQYRAWATDRWLYRGSIFDEYEQGSPGPRTPIRTAVVTVGTTESYDFDRLFKALVPLLRGCSVLWQVGTTDVAKYGIEGHVSVPYPELQAAMSEADVVIAHAGTGGALTAFEVGRTPVLVPRLARYQEHIDDHQLQIAAELDGRGLATAAAPEELTMALLETAGAGRVSRVRKVSPFVLADAVRV